MSARQCVNLAAEPADLLDRVATLVGDVLDATVTGRWPQVELGALVACLRAEVLPRAQHEECEVFARKVSPADRAQLHRDHRRLREATEVLARAAAGEGSRSTAHVAATARSLLAQLERHLASEREALALT
ncbi:MAG TPA: hypothetical protein VF218_04565 [Acidothermaceae bacterium]|jgi:hypothetical protein